MYSFKIIHLKGHMPKRDLNQLFIFNSNKSTIICFIRDLILNYIDA